MNFTFVLSLKMTLAQKEEVKGCHKDVAQDVLRSLSSVLEEMTNYI